MHAMKDLTRHDQLSGESHVEIKGLLKEAVGKLQGKVPYFNGKPRQYHILSALTFWFSQLDEQQMLAVGHQMLERLEAWMREQDVPRAMLPGRASQGHHIPDAGAASQRKDRRSG